MARHASPCPSASRAIVSGRSEQNAPADPIAIRRMPTAHTLSAGSASPVLLGEVVDVLPQQPVDVDVQRGDARLGQQLEPGTLVEAAGPVE